MCRRKSSRNTSFDGSAEENSINDSDDEVDDDIDNLLEANNIRFNINNNNMDTSNNSRIENSINWNKNIEKN